MYTPAWKRFITNVWFIVFVVVVLVTFGVRSILEENPIHTEFAKECATLGGFVRKVNGVMFCIDIQAIPDIIYFSRMSHEEKYKTSHDCTIAGGQMFDLSSNDWDYGCYKFTIFNELGARNDYVPSN